MWITIGRMRGRKECWLYHDQRDCRKGKRLDSLNIAIRKAGLDGSKRR